MAEVTDHLFTVQSNRRVHPDAAIRAESHSKALVLFLRHDPPIPNAWPEYPSCPHVVVRGMSSVEAYSTDSKGWCGIHPMDLIRGWDTTFGRPLPVEIADRIERGSTLHMAGQDGEFLEPA